MLAGVEPSDGRLPIVPHLPMSRFSLRMGNVGVAVQRGVTRGFVTVGRSGSLRMRVAPPRGTRASRAVAWAGGTRVRARAEAGLVVFTLPARAGRPADWAVGAPGR